MTRPPPPSNLNSPSVSLSPPEWTHVVIDSAWNTNSSWMIPPQQSILQYLQSQYVYRSPQAVYPGSSIRQSRWGAQLNSWIITPEDTVGEKEFSGFDMALGEVYGIRHWNIDDLGRLEAIAWSGQADFWKPGVNVARCMKGFTTTTVKVDGVVDPATGTPRQIQKVEYEREKRPIEEWLAPDGAMHRFDVQTFHITQEKVVRTHVTWMDGETQSYDGKLTKMTIPIVGQHAVPDEHCTCGFYAYNAREHDMYAGTGAGYVGGIIKGYGRTLIGPKGFRCEKAEIVALLDPTKGGDRNSAKRKRRAELLTRNYPKVPQLASWTELLEFAPLNAEESLPDPSTEEFWKR